MSTQSPSSPGSASELSRPLTRREALAAERAAVPAATPTESPATPAAVAEAPTRRRARRQSAPARPTRAARPAAAKKPKRVVRPSAPSNRRRVGTSVLSIVAMGFVAAVTVATSVPADALLSAEQVQARALDQAHGHAHVDGQSVNTDGATLSVLPEDGYAASSRAEYAAASGIRVANTFTNNPNGTIQWPFAVGVALSDYFGSTAGRSSAHRGLDFNPGLGAPIQAIADGVVSFSDDNGGSLGSVIMIDHVINGQTVTSVYAHAITGSLRFKAGDQVKVGDIVALTGDTGYSTGPHLHFEIRIGGKDGQQVDPLAWLYANTN